MRHFATFFVFFVKNQAGLFSDGAWLAQGFPTEPRLTDRERGTPRCLALEHRGCANWTSGSVASVQINREAAQESSGAVRGIWEASHPPRHTRKHTLAEREHSQVHEHNCAQQLQLTVVLAPKQFERPSEHCALPDRTPRPPDRGAIPGRAQLSHSPGTTCLWPHRTAGPGWSPEPWRQREHTARLEIRLFLKKIYFLVLQSQSFKRKHWDYDCNMTTSSVSIQRLCLQKPSVELGFTLPLSSWRAAQWSTHRSEEEIIYAAYVGVSWRLSTGLSNIPEASAI